MTINRWNDYSLPETTFEQVDATWDLNDSLPLTAISLLYSSYNKLTKVSKSLYFKTIINI